MALQLRLASWRLDSDQELTLEFRGTNPAAAAWEGATGRDSRRDTKGLPQEALYAVIAWAASIDQRKNDPQPEG
jgi:hypothetical protein